MDEAHELTALHRAMVVADKRKDDLCLASVVAHMVAKESMKPEDIQAALDADLAYHKANAEADAVERAYRKAIREKASANV